jgi:hypothetical protein
MCKIEKAIEQQPKSTDFESLNGNSPLCFHNHLLKNPFFMISKFPFPGYKITLLKW